MVQVYHFPQTMPRFLSLHKHYCALSRAWRACLYPRSGKVGSSQSLQSSLWLLLVSQWSLALKEEASYISPRSLQTSSTFGLIVATITLTSILRYRYHEYFLEKNDLKNLFEEKKSIGSLSAGNQNRLILIILCWEDQLIFTSLWFLLKPYPFQDCNFHKQQSLQNDLRATSSKTAQNYRAYFGLHSLDFSYKEIGIYHTSEFPEGVTKYFEKFMIAFHANESRMLKKRSAIITGLQ